MSDLLTDAEHRAMALSAELWNVLVREVVGEASTSRATDLRELAAHLHAIQQAVLSQAAGRAYPDRYRLLGQPLAETPPNRDFTLAEMSLDLEPSVFPGCGPPEVTTKLDEELSVKAVYEKLNALPARDRAGARWVMSWATLESLCGLSGQPKPLPGVAVSLVGLPVDVDPAAVGLVLRPRGDGKPWSGIGNCHTGAVA